MVVMFDETMILPAIPDFIQEFNISYSTSSWLLSAYIIAAAVMTPIGGKLSDIYGKKKILLIIMAVYAVGLMAGRFATNMEFMIVARAAQGVGMAMFPIAFSIIREVIPEKKLAIGQTIFSSTFSGGAVIGLVGGAVIIQNFGWQATFLAILPVTIALWVIIVKYVRINNQTSTMKGIETSKGMDNVPNGRTIDIKGAVALAAIIITFLAGISLMEVNNGNDSISTTATTTAPAATTTTFQVAGLFAASAVSLVAFIAIEKRVHSPLLDFKIMASKSFLLPTIILMLVFMSIFMVYMTIPVMVRSPEPFGFGGDAIAVASVQLPFMIVLLIGTITSGFILNRVKNTKILLLGTMISTIGFFVLLNFHSTENMISIGLTILAAGLALSIAGGFNVILLSVPIQVTGVALGMTLLLNLVGMSLGPALSGAFQEMYKGTTLGVDGFFPTDHAYSLIFVTSALVSLASAVMAISVARVSIRTSTMMSDSKSET